MAGYSNRGGAQAAPILVTNPSDEQVEYPAGTPPAIEEPRSYNVIGNGINATIIAGKPRNIYELYRESHAGFLWFPDIHSFVHSGKLMAFASLNNDDLENAIDAHVSLRSNDFGQTWSRSDTCDVAGFSNGPCRLRHFDSATGRLYEWGAFKMQPYPNDGTNRQTFRCERSYYANAGAKCVREANGSLWTGLPVPATADPFHITYPEPAAARPRHTWAALFGEGEIAVMADGGWGTVLDCELENPANENGQDAYFTGAFYKSYDKGVTWSFVNFVDKRESGVTENTFFRGPNNDKLVCIFRNFGADNSTPNKATISTDPTGSAWTPSFFPDPGNHGVARIGNSAPTSCALTGGGRILCAGRTGNDALNVSVNLDGGDSPDSVWGWWSLTEHHDFWANDGGTDLATASGAPGLIHKFWPNPSKSEVSTCYAGVTEIAPDEFMIIYDYTPSYRAPIGYTYQHLPNCIYVVHCKLVRG